MSLAAWRGGQLHFCQPLAAWPGHRRCGWTAAGSGKPPWEGLFPGGAGRPCRPGGLPGHPRRKRGPRGRPGPAAPPGPPSPYAHEAERGAGGLHASSGARPGPQGGRGLGVRRAARGGRGQVGTWRGAGHVCVCDGTGRPPSPQDELAPCPCLGFKAQSNMPLEKVSPLF